MPSRANHRSGDLRLIGAEIAQMVTAGLSFIFLHYLASPPVLGIAACPIRREENNSVVNTRLIGPVDGDGLASTERREANLTALARRPLR
jgi:hypothetical protein